MSPEFVALTSIYILALLSPGQDFFLILSTALHQGYKKAWWSCIGIAFGNMFYIILAFIGHTLFSKSILFAYIQIGGALFLIYLGVLLLKAPRTSETSIHKTSHVASKLFMQGMLSALLNPKNIIFYFSILFTIIAHDSLLHVKIFYTFWMVGLLLVWDMGIALLFGQHKAKRLLPYLYPLQKGIGSILILFGASEIYSFGGS